MIASPEQHCQAHPEWEQYCNQLAQAQSLSAMVWIALQMGLLLARRLVEQELAQRAARPTAWGNCPACNRRLHAKGWEPRSIQTVVGTID